jgi:hypothetical protein
MAQLLFAEFHELEQELELQPMMVGAMTLQG